MRMNLVDMLNPIPCRSTNDESIRPHVDHA
jgi:hypothetical protein